MSWRRNPSSVSEIGRLPEGARLLIMWGALLVAFLILGFAVMSGPVAETDKKIEQLNERSQRR